MTTAGRLEATLGALGARLGLTASQAYTVVTGIVVVAVLSAFGLPPVFRDVIERADLVAPPITAPDLDPTSVDTPVSVPPTGPTVPSLPTDLPGFGGGSPLPTTPSSPDTAAPAPATPPTLPPGVEVGTIELVAEIDRAGVPGAMVVDGDTIYLATDGAGLAGVAGVAAAPSVIVAVGPDGAVRDEWELADQPAVRTRGVSALAVDGDRVVVADAARSRLVFLDPASGELTDGPAIPDIRACIADLIPAPCEPTLALLPSEIAGLPLPLDDLGIDLADGLIGVDLPPTVSDVAVLGPDHYVVADQGQGVVWQVVGDEVNGLAEFPDRVPGQGPASVDVDRYGDLIVAVAARLLSATPGAPALYSIPLFDGTADEARPPADLSVAQPASDVAVGDSGRVYATVPAADQVIDVGMEQGDVIVVDTAAADPAIVAPDAVDMTDGWLYVAGGPAAGGRWAIHRIGIADVAPMAAP